MVEETWRQREGGESAMRAIIDFRARKIRTIARELTSVRAEPTARREKSRMQDLKQARLFHL